MRGLALAAWLLSPAIALAAAPVVTARPESVVLGNGGFVALEVQGDGGPLRGFTSVGTLEQDVQQGARATFRFRPPDIRYPTMAVLLFWTEANSARDIAVVRVPLLGRTDLKIRTEPRASVVVQIHDRKFGPVKADDRGNALVPIEVPPNVHSARVLVDAAGNKSNREAPIDAPDTNPLAAAFTAESFPADAPGTLIVAQAQGTSSAPEVTVKNGTAALKEKNGEVALYSVKANAGANDVVATVKLGEWKTDARSVVRAAGTPPATVDPAIAIWPFAAVGAFASGGANLGPGLMIGAGKTIMPNLTLEVETGARTSGVSSAVAGLGTANSRLVGFPLTVGARLRLLQLGATAVDGRAGLGVLFFTHSVSTDFQPSYSESGLRPDGFLAVAASLKAGAFEPFLEARAQWGAVGTERLLNARLGGAMLFAGTRYAWR